MLYDHNYSQPFDNAVSMRKSDLKYNPRQFIVRSKETSIALYKNRVKKRR